jgi:hypothetical protein
MRAVKRLLSLPGSSRRLLLQSALLLCWARILVWLAPFPVLLRFQRRFAITPSIPKMGRSITPHQAAWAVMVAGRVIPGASNCLVQALAANTLFAWTGYQTRLCIGVGKDEPSTVKAHAWVELDGRTVIGTVPGPGFTRLLSLGGGRG